MYEVLRPVALSGKHAMVKTAGAAIAAVLEWARINEYRSEESPVEIVRRSLPKRSAGPKHHDALHWSEVGAALAKIDVTNCAPSTKRAIRFTALTAALQIEVRRATWDQLIRKKFPHAEQTFAKLGLGNGEYTMPVQGYRRPDSAYMVVCPVQYASPKSEEIIRETSARRRKATQALADRYSALPRYLVRSHARARRRVASGGGPQAC